MQDLATHNEDWVGLPDKYLPPVEQRDLPEPVPLRKLLGASVILLATALGSGELVLWPYIISQVGISILALAAVGFTAQYFINMEVERYTLATGETAVTGFTRLWKWWGVFFILGAILTNAWPAWATGSVTLLSFTLGWDTDIVPILSAAFLVILGIVLTASPVV